MVAAMDGARALEQLLGSPPPEGLVTATDDADLGRLADAIDHARRTQRAALAASGDAALGFIPALLRRPVKRIVGLR
jgi:hypothetical protein